MSLVAQRYLPIRRTLSLDDIDGANKQFLWEKMLHLINEKLRYINLEQVQIIANQIRSADWVWMNEWMNETLFNQGEAKSREWMGRG